MEVRVFDTYEELSREAANIIIAHVRQNSTAVLGLATGSSPLGLYRELIRDHKENGTSYQNVMTFNLDEYVGLEKTHPQSYYYFMMENLFNHINIPLDHINIPNGTAKDIAAECQRYNERLAQHTIDIQILGIGANGHIGFNEPGTPFDSTTHFVKLDEKTRQDNARFFSSIDEVPTHAITMGIQNIMAAKKIILLASGTSKADAIYGMIKGPVDPQLPASILQTHSDVLVFLDKEAASKL
ncbi:MAG TPA: glucosamine-6-phosphate deaminase [Haloplasmataceae bacterium]